MIPCRKDWKIKIENIRDCYIFTEDILFVFDASFYLIVQIVKYFKLFEIK